MMHALGLIVILTTAAMIDWMENTTFAANQTPQTPREVSTASEHYWVVDANGREVKQGS